MGSLEAIGILTVLHESAGFVGGYLVTNRWGRPLEFRLSTAVQPNRIQQILYGKGLQRYVYSDLIGKTLVEKASSSVNFVLTDSDELIDLRHHCRQPVFHVYSCREALPVDQSPLAATDVNDQRSNAASSMLFGSYHFQCHPDYSTDYDCLQKYAQQLHEMDFNELFQRVREALQEARKLGATQRAA